MPEIIPAIIGQNFAEVLEKLNKVKDWVDWVQLDITDGIFTPEYSWQKAEDLEPVNGPLKLEVHLMVSEPANIIADWLKVVDRIIVHLEASERIEEIIAKLEHTPIELGIALLLDTNLSKITPYLAQIKNIQLMSIATIGHYGEKLDEKVFARIKALRAMDASVKISVDGGVNLGNAKKLIDAGADRLVIGSSIWQAPNLSEAIKQFQCI